MKNIRLFSLIITSLLMLNSCSKEDDDAPAISNPNKGSLTIGVVETELGHGEIVAFQKIISGLYEAAPIYLMGSSFHAEATTISGKDHGIELEVYTSGADNITPGTYNISNDISSLQTFKMGVYTEWDLSTNAVTGYYKATSGKLKVSRSGNVYTLDISIIADKYDIGQKGVPPTGPPLESGVEIKSLFKGDLKQKYFTK